MSPPAPSLRLSSAPGRWVLAAAVLGSSMATIDSTVVGIALPAIGRNFALPVSSLQWVVSAYLLALAGLLLVGGALGDRYGRRRVFLIGVTWFALASLLCALAPDSLVLVGARALQGMGGALLTPGSLAILQASFAPDDRSRAIGAWTGLSGVGTAVGPFLGGFLVTALSWRLIFLINLPVAVAVVVVGLRHLPESRDPSASGRVDVPGGLLVSVGLVGLCSALITLPSSGWGSVPVVAGLAVAAAAFAAFVRHEGRVREPLVPLGLFRARQFSVTNAVTFVVYAALGGALFLLPVQLEQVSGYSPLAAGVSLLPLTAVMLVFSARSGALAARIGPRLQMSIGPVVVGAGMVLLGLVGTAGTYGSEVLPGVLVLALGLALTVAPLTATAMSSAPMEHASVASAVNNDVARGGSLVAVAVLPALAGLGGSSYLHPALFSAGFHRAVVVAGAAAAVGGVLAAAGVRNPAPADRGAPEPASLACALDATSPSGYRPGSRSEAGALRRPPTSGARAPRDARMAP